MTSIEWLEGQFKIYLPSIHQKGLENSFEQAKEMHRKEIIDAFQSGDYGSKGNDKTSDFDKPFMDFAKQYVEQLKTNKK
jgi:hypothetical protein